MEFDKFLSIKAMCPLCENINNISVCTYKMLNVASAPSESPCDGILPKEHSHEECACHFVIGYDQGLKSNKSLRIDKENN